MFENNLNSKEIRRAVLSIKGLKDDIQTLLIGSVSKVGASSENIQKIISNINREIKQNKILHNFVQNVYMYVKYTGQQQFEHPLHFIELLNDIIHGGNEHESYQIINKICDHYAKNVSKKYLRYVNTSSHRNLITINENPIRFFTSFMSPYCDMDAHAVNVPTYCERDVAMDHFIEIPSGYELTKIGSGFKHVAQIGDVKQEVIYNIVAQNGYIVDAINARFNEAIMCKIEQTDLDKDLDDKDDELSYIETISDIYEYLVGGIQKYLSDGCFKNPNVAVDNEQIIKEQEDMVEKAQKL